MFIGRKQEMEFLNDRYNSNQAEFVVLYGRRRVGKTELLHEFCKNKPTVFYSCREYTDSVQLKAFSSKILSYDIPARKYVSEFTDWDSAFSSLVEIPGDEKRVIVIDEFPYMCKANSSIPSVLQILWDEKLRKHNIMLILCGSSMSFIEKELLSEKNPLYGRMTGIYKMLPMPYYDAVKFFPDYSDEDKILAYSILGGIPHYLKQFDSKRTLDENIKKNILTKGTVLYSEVEFLLRQELRESAVYNTIIQAIALGNTALNDIYTKTMIEKPKLSVYIKNLIDLGIVEREFSALSKAKEKANNSRGEYRLIDSYFRFWYAFAFPNMSDLENGDTEGVWKYNIKNNLHSFASKAFENISIDYVYILNKSNRLPFRISSAARWWGKVTHTDNTGKKVTSSAEIDVIATDTNESKFIIGECKFTNDAFDLGQYKALVEKFKPKGAKYYFLFALNGFTDAVQQETTKANNLFLITAKDMLSAQAI